MTKILIICALILLIYFLLSRFHVWREQQKNKELNSEFECVCKKHRKNVHKTEKDICKLENSEMPVMLRYIGEYDYLPTINVKRGDVVFFKGREYVFDKEWIELGNRYDKGRTGIL